MTYEKKFFHKGLGFGLCCCDPCDELIPGGTVPEWSCDDPPAPDVPTYGCFYRTQIPDFVLKASQAGGTTGQQTLNDWGGVTVKPSSEMARLVWEFSSYRSGGGGVWGQNKDHWIQNLSRLFFDFEAGKMTWELDGPLCTRPGLGGGPIGPGPLTPGSLGNLNGTETRTGNPQHIWTEKHFALDDDGALKIDWCRRYDHFALYLQGDAVGLFPADLYSYGGPHPAEYYETRSWLGVDCLNLEQWAAEGSWTVDWYNYRFHGKGLDKQTWFDSCNHFDATVCDRGRSPSYLYKVGKNAYDKRKIRRIKAEFSGLPGGYSERFFNHPFGGGFSPYQNTGAGFDLSNLAGKQVTLTLMPDPDGGRPNGWQHSSGGSSTFYAKSGYHWPDNRQYAMPWNPGKLQLLHQTRNPVNHQIYIGQDPNTHPPDDGTPLNFWNNRHSDYPDNRATFQHTQQTEHSLYVPHAELPWSDSGQRAAIDNFWTDWFEFETGEDWGGHARTGLWECFLAVHAGGMVSFNWMVKNEVVFLSGWQTSDFYGFTNFWQVDDRDDFILVDNHNGISDMVLPISGNLPDPGYYDNCGNGPNRPDLKLSLMDSLAYVSNCLVTITSDDGGLP